MTESPFERTEGWATPGKESRKATHAFISSFSTPLSPLFISILHFTMTAGKVHVRVPTFIHSSEQNKTFTTILTSTHEFIPCAFTIAHHLSRCYCLGGWQALEYVPHVETRNWQLPSSYSYGQMDAFIHVTQQPVPGYSILNRH